MCSLSNSSLMRKDVYAKYCSMYIIGEWYIKYCFYCMWDDHGYAKVDQLAIHLLLVQYNNFNVYVLNSLILVLISVYVCKLCSLTFGFFQSLVTLLESCVGNRQCYSMTMFQDLLVSTNLSPVWFDLCILVLILVCYLYVPLL